tara:strand:+ start:194 stop:415 length:222 start_codon:yes stop_codon:yes gene_type:complete
MSINDYTGNQFEIMDDYDENKSGSLCPPCCCLSNFYSCLCLPLKLCMGLSWIGSCGLSFYVGNMYGKGELMNI